MHRCLEGITSVPIIIAGVFLVILFTMSIVYKTSTIRLRLKWYNNEGITHKSA
jgi:hypothetical protein